jgi:hypothetical protein
VAVMMMVVVMVPSSDIDTVAIVLVGVTERLHSKLFF